MHRVLQIPELLRIIFEHGEKEAVVQCAQVSTMLSEVALDVLWHTADNLPAFANLLAPVKKGNNNDGLIVYEFDPLPSFKGWSRFQSTYCSRVRVLHLKDHGCVGDSDDCDISPLLNIIQRLRSSSPLLPKLHTLQWEGNYDRFLDSVMFMHEGVRDYCLRPEYLKRHEMESIAEVITTRMSSLTALELDAYPSQEDVETLLKVFRNLPTLAEITIPAFRDISRILLCLSRSPMLKRLSFCSYGEDRAVMHTGIALQGEIFASLVELCIRTHSYSNLSSFLSQHRLQGLRSFQLYSLVIEERKAVEHLFQLVSSFAPDLVELAVLHFADSDSDRPATADNIPIDFQHITFDDFRAISRLPKMTTFQFSHPFQLSLSDDNIEELSVLCPQLENLFLDSEPIRHSTQTCRNPTVQSLFYLTRSCPNLQDVELLFDTTAQSCETAGPAAARLSSLDVGNSEIAREDAYRFAMSIGHFCYPHCELLWPDELDEDTKSRWQAVKDLFPLFSDLHSKMRKQEQEITSLQARLTEEVDERA